MGQSMVRDPRIGVQEHFVEFQAWSCWSVGHVVSSFAHVVGERESARLI